MNTCGPATKPKKLPITHMFEAPMWASLILLLCFLPILYFVFTPCFSWKLFHTFVCL